MQTAFKWISMTACSQVSVFLGTVVSSKDRLKIGLFMALLKSDCTGVEKAICSNRNSQHVHSLQFAFIVASFMIKQINAKKLVLHF